MSLPYEFRDDSLLELALTHSSTRRGEDNERLEFLGDAVLDLVIVEALYADEARYAEGPMTEMKSAVVSRRSLAEAASELGLHTRAHLGQGLKAETLPRSVLANLYEAVLGAVYLDAGLEAARSFVLETLSGELERALVAAVRQQRAEDPPAPARPRVLVDEAQHGRRRLLGAEGGGESGRHRVRHVHAHAGRRHPQLGRRRPDGP